MRNMHGRRGISCCRRRECLITLDYSFSVGHEDGKDLEPNGPGGGSPELRRRLRILMRSFRGLPLVEMAPDFDTVRHAEVS